MVDRETTQKAVVVVVVVVVTIGGPSLVGPSLIVHLLTATA